MTKEGFGSRNFDQIKRRDAVFYYYMCMSYQDWMIIYSRLDWQEEYEANRKLRGVWYWRWRKVVDGNLPLKHYSISVGFRWRKFAQRENYITNQVAIFRSDTPLY